MKPLDDDSRFSPIESKEQFEGGLQQEEPGAGQLERFLYEAVYPCARNGTTRGIASTPVLEIIQKPQPQGLNRKQRRMNAKRMRNENA